MIGNLSLLYLASRISLSTRIYIAYIVILIACFSMPLITEYLPKSTAWWLLLSTVAINGLANAFVQGGMFGFASIFPPQYLSIMMVGQGVNGMLLNSVKMLLLVVLPPDENDPQDVNSYVDSLIFLGVFGVILIAAMV